MRKVHTYSEKVGAYVCDCCLHLTLVHNPQDFDDDELMCERCEGQLRPIRKSDIGPIVANHIRGDGEADE